MRRTTTKLPHLAALAVLFSALAIARGASAQTPGNAQGDPSQTPPVGPRPNNAATTEPTGAAAQSEPAVPPGGSNTPDGGTAMPPARDLESCPGPRVVRVRFTGLARVAAADIRGSVHVNEGTCYTREMLQRDARALWDLGFFNDVQVAADPTDQGGIEVRFALTERPSIHEIRLEGREEVEEDQVRERIELREGSVVSENAVRHTAQRIRDLYNEKGYFLAEITSEVVRREGEGNEADVVFRIHEGPKVQVRSINFVGNASISSDDLRGAISTSTAGFFSFLTNSGTYREEAFRNDVDMLHAAYYDRGYLNVEIDNPRVSLSPDRRFLDITIFVREGSRYHVGRVAVTEVDDSDEEIEPLGGRAALRRMLHVAPDDWFSRSVIGHDILAVQTHYRDAGYASVEVTPDVVPHPEEHVVDLGLRIRRGPMTYVHRIVVRGNAKTSDRVIRRELQLFEGDRYNETNYQASRARVMALGYFERVDLSTETVEGHPEWIQVNVEVVERPTGTFQVGAGFSSIETFIFTAQVQQLNLFGRGQSLTFQAQFSGLRQIFSLRFVEPYLWDSNWTGALDLYNTLRAYTDFTRNSTGGALTAGYPLIGLNDLRMFLTYTGEQVDVNTTRSGAIFGQTTAPSAFAQLPLARLFQSGFTSSLGLAFTVDTRDNRLYPSNGIYARVGVDVADSFLGSQNIYTRWSGFFRFYTPIGPAQQGAQGAQGVVLKGNLNVGYVGSRDPRGVPIFERYFLGGIMDVRGFNLRSIGPRLQLPQSFDPNSPIVSTGAVIGGNLQMYYNLELEFPILNQVGLRGVIFQDAGNVFNTEAQFCNASGGRSLDRRLDVVNPCVVNPVALRYAWGFGLRWFSPLGLLRFEWGFPFEPLSFEQSSNFQFTIGNFF